MIDLKKLSAQEMEIIEEFRKRMAAVCPKELEEYKCLLYRFLKARDFNLNKAEKMLRRHLAWKKANQVDNVLKEFKPKEFYVKYIEPSSLGYDKEGDSVLYIMFGKLDSVECFKCFTMNESLRHWIWVFEKQKSLRTQHFDKENELHRQFHIVIDLDELTFSNCTSKETIDFLLRLLHLFQDNYPEEMKCLVIINAPSYYMFCWSALKVFMSNAMLKKIQIYGHNGWQDKLIKNIDEKELPSFLGGKRTDPDGNPQCITFVVRGGKIHPKYHITNEERGFKDRSRVQQLKVPPSSVREVYVDVQDEGEIIQWEILIQSKDIGFGLFYKEKDELQEVLPVQRLDTVDGVDKNYYRAKLVGKYVFIFDNSDSWLTTKDIEYCITVKQDPG